MAPDIEERPQLEAYLRRLGHLGSEGLEGFRVLAGGVSNRTVLVSFRDGRRWVLKQALARLRVKVDWFSSPARVVNEGRGLVWLNALTEPGSGSVPKFVFLDEEAFVLAMEAVPEPHANLKQLLMDGGEGGWEAVARSARLLARVHVESAASAATVRPVFEDASFFESLRLEPYYGFAAEQAPSAAPFLRALCERTRERRLCLVHGDFSPKNLLVCEGRVILLDHEVIHWGDPAFDAGFFLTHLLSKARHFPARRHDFLDAARSWWLGYLEVAGAMVAGSGTEAQVVRHLLGCLLARVAGRSPLEYLSGEEMAAQRRDVLRLMDPTNLANDVPTLISQYQACLF